MRDPHAETPLVRDGAAPGQARAAVVLLHGRGAGAAGILDLVPELAMAGVAYLTPEASGRTWYPYSFLAGREANEPWLGSALARVDRIVRDLEAEAVPAERVVLLGFSQGACLATDFVARNPRRYGGLLAFTGGLIGPPDERFDRLEGDLAGTPAFLGAGDPDPHVPWARVEESGAVLRRMGAEVTLRRYPGMPHTVSDDEIAFARALLRGILEG